MSAKRAPGPRYEAASCAGDEVTSLRSGALISVTAFMISLGKLLDVSLLWVSACFLKMVEAIPVHHLFSGKAASICSLRIEHVKTAYKSKAQNVELLGKIFLLVTLMELWSSVFIFLVVTHYPFSFPRVRPKASAIYGWKRFHHNCCNFLGKRTISEEVPKMIYSTWA